MPENIEFPRFFEMVVEEAKRVLTNDGDHVSVVIAINAEGKYTLLAPDMRSVEAQTDSARRMKHAFRDHKVSEYYLISMCRIAFFPGDESVKNATDALKRFKTLTRMPGTEECLMILAGKGIDRKKALFRVKRDDRHKVIELEEIYQELESMSGPWASLLDELPSDEWPGARPKSLELDVEP